MSNVRELKALSRQEIIEGYTKFHSVSLVQRAKALLAGEALAVVNFRIKLHYSDEEEQGELCAWIESNYPGHLEIKASDEQIKLLTPRERAFIKALSFEERAGTGLLI